MPDTNADAIRAGAADAQEQLRELRAQVEMLMRDRVTPAVAGAVGRAGDAVKHVGDLAADKSEALTKSIQDRPMTALIIAATVGFVVGRITR